MPASTPAAAPADPDRIRSEKTPAFRVLAALILPFMYAISRYEFHHPEKLPRQGAFVLAPNHFSNIDPIVVGIGMWKLGRAPRYFAKASLFRVPVLGYFMRRTGQVPVQRSGAGRAGGDPIQAGRMIAEHGLGVIVYPEGTLTRDPNLWPMRGKTGAVRTALEAGVPVIPCAHWGTQAIMPRYGKGISVFPRHTVQLSYGDPVDLDEFRGRPLDSAMLAAATERVMDAITRLVEELRGEKAPAERWDPAKHHQSETGRF
ncbi:lysophospholipid acyltransferase family protein [Galbitalea soli]|uniref:lysophospholipid acyltransferase family protein n=1 Tax=Galbitalea soli TaxID=1268042 RepID=UPI0017AFD85C|nr:1-acyl-sn-glycerol-3-phosphate acyltransferase [Galbitalea soli]